MLAHLLFICQAALFQISGTVKDKNTQEVLPSAYVSVKGIGVTTSNHEGVFTLKNVPSGSYVLLVSYTGYSTYEDTIQVSGDIQSLIVELIPSEVNESVVIQAIRADDKIPVTITELNKVQIQNKYYGYDVPYVINNTPSVNAYSDNGVGIGYTYFRMRGIDQTRINLTVDGIPINDPENQGFYFNNFADLTSSAQKIQIQRGVSTSTNGSSAFGGAINILTTNLSSTPNATVHLGYGSFNTSRVTVEANTGMLPGKVAFYGRVGQINTDGYRDHSGSNIKSYFFSAAKYGNKSVLKLNVWGGYAANKLAYVGISKGDLDTNRKFNPLTTAETDYFNQNVIQLQYSKSFNSRWKMSASLYHMNNTGWFDVRFNDWYYSLMNMPDVNGSPTADFMARYNLKQRFNGVFGYLQHTYSKGDMYLGVHANAFAADHYMTVPWASAFPAGYDPTHEAYFNTGYKNEVSMFFKNTHAITSKLTSFIDLQVRYSSFRYKAEDKPIYRDTFNVENMHWVFFNPKAGLTYTLTKSTSLYASVGATSREPARLDYLTDDRANFDVKQSDVKPEHVIDIEAGTRVKNDKWQFQGNVYAMEFKNEIVQTGQLNSFGFPLRSNTKSSFRRGVEIDLTYKISKSFSLINSTSLSYNRIKEFNQKYSILNNGGNYLRDTIVTYNNVTPVYTPSFILNQGVRYNYNDILSVEIIGKYMAKTFLDNSNAESLTLPAFGFIDARATMKFNRWIKSGDYALSVQVNNITNQLYAHTGSVNILGYSLTQNGGTYTNTTAPSYFAAATRNVMVTLSAKF
ncbi:MAG: TonB-dependent receptor [Cytophagaceae bacterium]